MRLRIDILGDKQMQRNLLRGAAEASNMRPALREIADDMMRVIGATFNSQGRRYGGSWTRLKPATIREKLRKRLDPRTLIARRRLMNSLTRPRSRNMELTISGSDISLDSKLVYAKTHQYGDEERGIPARPFVRIYPQDRARWARIAEDHLRKAITNG